MSDRRAVLVAAHRTPLRSVRAGGAASAAQRRLSPVDLAALTLAAAARQGAALGPPRDVVLGSACPPPGNLARVAALAAGLGDVVPGVTIDRQCGAGLDAVRLAAALIGAGQLGTGELLLAGGVEAPSSSGTARASFAPPGHADPEMGPAAEELAAGQGISRERQDAYAHRSYALAAACARAGGYDDEIVAVPTPDGPITRDDRPRAVRAEVLARLGGAFADGGSVTAGNTAGPADGAAVVALTDESGRRRLGRPGLRVLGSAAAGVATGLPGLGAVPAVREVLRRTGIGLDRVAVIEIVEAFAAQQLACTDALGLDPLGADAHRVCPQGGAIGLGHPWGASGALVVVRLYAQLVRRDVEAGTLGLAACSVGGGQGVALLVERT